MRISDEIRDWCDEAETEGCSCVKMREVADRIDREMIKLPKDADGVPIRLGDTVYTPTGKMYDVIEISFTPWDTYIKCKDQDAKTYVFLGGLSHDRPDSLERIADEMEVAEKWCDQNGDYGTGISSVGESTLRGWADRIRKLAKEGER